MSIRLTILGCHSATPRSDAHPTSQYLEINNRHFLIDCGEGTQMQLRKYKVKFSRIKHIFISHLHG
ncbi:MAG: ribonuclease Z, partial [Lutimonas sp.]